MDKCISQFREVTNVNGNEYLLLAYPNIRNVKIKIENIANFISKVLTEGDSSFVSDAPTDGILYGRKDKKWEQITFPDVTIYLKKDDAKLLYQPIGNYLTEIPEEYVTETELNNKGYLTEHQDISGKLDISVYNSDKETFALKVELPDVSNFITKSVSDLENYYRKNETYTQTQVKDLINSITTINFEVVDNLPEQDQKENIIYLVPSSKTEEQNVKDEYIWINNNWELIGSTKIDLSGYALKDEIPTKVSQLTNDSGYITTIPDDYITNTELENKRYATITQLNDKLDIVTYNTDKETFALKSDIPDVSGFITSTTADATYQPIGDYITEIKTINGQSLVGSGNIEIQGGGGGISDAPSDGNKYVRQDGNWVEETTVDTSNFATKAELEGKVDDSEIADMATETWVTQQGFLTEHQDISNLATKTEVVEGLASKQNKGNYALKSDLNDLATKDELATKADTSALSAYATTSAMNSALASKADKTALNNVNTTLTERIDDIVIPTDISAFNNDVGYLTEHQDISNLATKEELASKANTSDLSNYLTTANASTTYETISGAQSKYQPVGEYALKSEIPSLSGYATESYVNTQVSNLVNSAPETLNTLDELAAALNDDSNFATTVANQIGTKLDTSTYNSEKANFATKSEVNAKVSGTGITGIQVVTELPGSPTENVLYIVTAA